MNYKLVLLVVVWIGRVKTIVIYFVSSWVSNIQY